MWGCGWRKDVVKNIACSLRVDQLILVTALRLGHELNITEIKTEFSSSSFYRFCGFSRKSYIWRKKHAPGMIYCSSGNAVERFVPNCC